MRHLAMGGTFDVLHRGHRLLLDTAFADPGRSVFIGVTADAFAARSRTRRVRPLKERVAALQDYLGRRMVASRAEIGVIEDVFGRALDPTFDGIVVTEETRSGADAINAERAKLGIPPLGVLLAPFALADDGLPVKATRIAKGEVDAEGRLVAPVRVALGSANPVKAEATRRAFARVFTACRVGAYEVPSGVPAQPRGAETWQGARARARAALGADPVASFGVGIEAGLLAPEGSGSVLDTHVAVVVDRGGRETSGHGAGFALPQNVMRRVTGGASVGEAMDEVAGTDGIGRGEGAIGYLTKGIVDRVELAEAALLAALVPRMRPEAYGLDVEG